MKINWYVILPLLGPVIAWGFAAYYFWHGVTDWFGVGMLVGIGFVGIIQSLYRWMLRMADEENEELKRLLGWR